MNDMERFVAEIRNQHLRHLEEESALRHPFARWPLRLLRIDGAAAALVFDVDGEFMGLFSEKDAVLHEPGGLSDDEIREAITKARTGF